MTKSDIELYVTTELGKLRKEFDKKFVNKEVRKVKDDALELRISRQEKIIFFVISTFAGAILLQIANLVLKQQ